jgi:hypothetical protein
LISRSAVRGSSRSDIGRSRGGGIIVIVTVLLR